MKHPLRFAVIFAITLTMSACETRSKFVAKNVYDRNKEELSSKCLQRVRSVESRQFVKNAALVAIPIGGIFVGAYSIAMAAATNVGITLDDEINANRIAVDCNLVEKQKDNREIAVTIAQNMAISAVGGQISPINMPGPVQTGIE